MNASEDGRKSLLGLKCSGFASDSSRRRFALIIMDTVCLAADRQRRREPQKPGNNVKITTKSALCFLELQRISVQELEYH